VRAFFTPSIRSAVEEHVRFRGTREIQNKKMMSRPMVANNHGETICCVLAKMMVPRPVTEEHTVGRGRCSMSAGEQT
jgi:hypothetical protein